MALTREDRLFIALQKCAGALQMVVDRARWPDDRPIVFAGDYADLGTMTVSQILDEANEALEEE